VTIRGDTIGVEIARTAAEQHLGLGERDGLAWERGMLFVYDRPGFYGFWMKGMRFDIDIVWIRDGRIVGIDHRVPHAMEPPLPTYRPPEAVDQVLEVPAGAAQARGWRRGDRVRVETLDAAQISGNSDRMWAWTLSSSPDTSTPSTSNSA
jgi:hypothetical protein